MTESTIRIERFIDLNYTRELEFLKSNNSTITANHLLNEYKDIIKKEIIKQFSLETIFKKVYKSGANVSTVRNAKDGIFRDDKEKYNFNKSYSRNDIDRDVHRVHDDGSKELLSMGLHNLNKYSRKLINEEISSLPEVIKTKMKNPSHTEKNAQHINLSKSASKQVEGIVSSSKKEKGKVFDGYNTSRTYNVAKDKKDPIDIDHIVSAKEIHDNNFLRMKLSPDQLSILTNNPSNLTFTNRSANQSKGRKPLLNWAKEISKKDANQINAERFDLNMMDVQKKEMQARASIRSVEKKLIFQEYGIKGTKEGVKEGALIGLKHSFGLFMLQFTNALIDELKGYFLNFKNYSKEKTRFEEFIKRCHRVKEKMKDVASEILTEFSTGFISGFLNNFITIFINQVKTTSKRLNRLIGESFFGVVEGVRALGSSHNDKYKNALIAFSSAVVGAIGGIATETLISYLRTTPFSLFAEIIGATVGGILTGLAVVTIVTIIQDYKNFIEDFKSIFKRDELTQDEIKDKVEEILSNIDDDYRIIVNKIYREYTRLIQVTQDAFDTSVSSSRRFDHTIAYATEMNVEEDTIIRSHKEIDSFFLD